MGRLGSSHPLKKALQLERKILICRPEDLSRLYLFTEFKNLW